MVEAKYLQANGLRIAYEEFGEPSDPAIVLIMGLGQQLTEWPDEFCTGLAREGFRVIRFDNRDVGLSDKISGARAPGMMQLAMAANFGVPVKVPYKIFDMALDAVGVLDALDIDAAHLVGISMGAMIAQIVAGQFPDRVLSLTSMSSTSGARHLRLPELRVTRHMTSKSGPDRADYVQKAVETWRMIESPAYPMSDSELYKQIVAGFERSFYPAGFIRQMAAVMASGDRVRLLRKLQLPALVIHGKDDVLVPVSGGIDTAKRIPGARLELFEGMGHDLPQPLLDRFVELIVENARLA